MAISMSAFWLMIFEMTLHPSLHKTGITIICCRTQYVVVSQLYSIVNLCFSEPGLLVPRGEDLHSHTFSHPSPPPHLPVPAFTWKRSGTITQLLNNEQNRANKWSNVEEGD